MASLVRTLRKDLENAVKKARRVAEAGARQAIEQLAVQNHEPWPTLTPPQRKLRNRLRAHGRQLGDALDERRGAQGIEHLVGECAYEHWHRLLFARFLAENDLLIEPESGMALSLSECQELARERGTDWLPLASSFAQGMLPQIFRAGDPVLEVTLPPETRQTLEQILAALPREVFVADDSLGWVYQYWQADNKTAINESETKIGADELAAVTQLFTEDYMVLFLLENTLGAWWAGRHLAKHPEQATSAESEDALRAACSPPGTVWRYLRFTRAGGEPWRPAAGVFEGWPMTAAHLRLLDPCMGSGHFLVFALPILVSFRRVEEGLSVADAVRAVLRDNLFGLELDPRCTQIAAFNLALAAWRLAGHQALPALHLACSGLGVNAKEVEWLALAGNDARLRAGMERLHRLFQQGPTLGSLINPRALGGDLLEAGFGDLQPLLDQAIAREVTDETAHELAVTARGLAQAAEILAGRFTLVSTNVPYLGRGKQDEVLKGYCERAHLAAKADLATCFVERCLDFCAPGGSTALVTPQNWLFLGTYTKLRQRLLEVRQWNAVARLGPRAFETISGEVVNVALLVLTANNPNETHVFAGLDASEPSTPDAKAAALRESETVSVGQKAQLGNPDARVTLSLVEEVKLVSSFGDAYVGILNGDSPRFIRFLWEISDLGHDWRTLQSTVETTIEFGGRERIIFWQNGTGELRRLATELQERLHDADTRGNQAWGTPGVAISQMGDLPATLYSGDLFDSNASVITLKEEEHQSALWAFCSSPAFREAVRRIDQKVNVTNATLAKIPFDLAHWRTVAVKKYPSGLPKPHSDNPTQWLFNGHPKASEQPLQVAVARLVGYRWPRQTGSSFPDCSSLGPDGLEAYADKDGIVCLGPLRGEASAADRLRVLLAAAYGAEWSPGRQNELLKGAGFAGKSFEEWLRDSFFEQHCTLFHQRPVIWQIWDGLRNGFSALVNYHQLAGPNGEGRRTIEKLIYTYLGDWIDRQRADQADGVEGADAQVASAEHLKRELEKILEGEPPCDLFVRWTPLDRQPIGWEPDINDGVRVNIRPFMIAKPLNTRGKNACILRSTPKIKWDKDRGKEPQRPKRDFPWFWGWDEQTQDFAGGRDFDGNRWNDLHYKRAVKQAARERAKTGGKT
jgi:hypothetical protein